MLARTRPINWLLLVCLSLGSSLVLGQRRGDRVNPYEKVSDVYRDLWRKGELKKALESVDKAIRASADSVPVYWLTDRAELFFQTGQVARAIDEIEWLEYRRPSPIYAWQLAGYYRAAGRLSDFDELIDQAWIRASGYKRDGLETDEALALNGIAEVRGENPRAIFQSILKGKMKTKEDRLLRNVAAGELAFRKFDYALAATYFEKALAEDEGDLPALAGLANCYWQSFDARLAGILERIEAINPLYPAAQAIRIEQDLDANAVDDGLARIERQLARNAVDLRFLGLKLAAYFLQDNHPGMAALELETFDYNPHASEVFRIAGRIASRHYRFEEGAAFQKKALQANPQDALAQAYYAQDLLRLGRDSEGRKSLEEAFAADRFNVQVFNILELMDKVSDFATLRRGPFLLKMPKLEVPIWGEDVLALLNNSYQRYTKKYAVQLSTPISIQIFDDHDDFMVRSVGLPGSAGHLGICFGQLVTMDSPTARAAGAMNWRSVLLHEFVHVVTLQKTKNRMARWLSEGISVYEQIQIDPGWAHRLEPDYKWIVAADGIPGVADLTRLFTQPKTPNHLMFGYFSAGEFVRFFVDQYGFEPLNRAMEQMAKGKLTLPALLVAAGQTEAAMDRGFKTFLEKRFAPFDALPAVNSAFLNALENTAAAVLVQPFDAEPGTFHRALEEAETSVKKQAWDEATKAFWRAYSLYPDYRGAHAPLNRLAKIFSDRQMNADLEKVLSLAAWSGETELWACLALAQSYQAQAKWPDVLKTVRRALDIDPFDVVLNRMQLEALGHLGKTKRQLQVLTKLIQLDGDRMVTYRLQRIDLLIKQGATVAAKKETVDLLEEMPSSWEAQKRLLALVEGSASQGRDHER